MAFFGRLFEKYIQDVMQDATHGEYEYIAEVKQKCGIIERENYNKPKSEYAKRPQCPPDKEKAIKEALKFFRMV